MSSAASVLPELLPAPSTGIRALARLGFLSIGFVYLVLGALTTMAAIGVRGADTADQQQVFQTIQHLPLGQVLLWLVAVGLVGYVVWRFTQALLDTEGKGHGTAGLAVRGFYIFSGLLYSLLAYYAGKMAWYGHRVAETGTTKSVLREALRHNYGQWLLGLAGLTVLVAGVVQIYRALSGKFDTDVNGRELTDAQCRLVYRTGQVGYSARGVVLVIMGYFGVKAALHANANEIRDTAGTFDALQAMGPAVLGVVALGLVAFGAYMLVQARFPILRGLGRK
ncbi:DUF1206 domain-containing protein [Hymenobacter chitinivorans]|uniref:Uncharacterized protein DUF1206 n=1 Tax=Hymenobacter chitinivorans DSM 11115 TaxID=1121954 RepID=A0A2M9BPC8_9BACT|nr:DUF1206 domain-containing protein [Hymenobacter chitinivorans]PJJ59797.1 uncharacterized protein DUF1206 [Hymenobacter chitinivorans DSM 11115]